MNASAKITTAHLNREAFVYVRQSTDHQVRNNLESQQRQYELAELACRLGWRREAVVTIDDDLGRSGRSAAGRTGFARLVSQVALGKVGIVFGLEVSRLARNNKDWYQLLDLCSITQTLIADADGVYDPSFFNDRLLLGLKGTMSEAELHVLHSRMIAGMKHKAGKGELKFFLPPGYQFDDQNRIVQTPDEHVRHMIDLVFKKVFEVGSVSGVLLQLLEDGLLFPRKSTFDRVVRWVRPYYKALYDTITNPLYAGTYVYGRSKVVKELDSTGVATSRQRKQPMDKWQVVIHNHHPAYITWEDFLRIRKLLERNQPAAKDQASQAVREGAAWLQGLVFCGKCGRAMHVRYSNGKHGVYYATYYCRGGSVFAGQPFCQSVGGKRLDEAVATHFLEQVEPVKIDVEVETLRRCRSERDLVTEQLRLELERNRYQAGRLARQYDSAEPENRLVARTLEAQWNDALKKVREVEQRIAERQRELGAGLNTVEETEVRSLVCELSRLWNAATTTDKDRKMLFRAALERVQILKDGPHVELKIVWKGGAVVERTVQMPKMPHRPNPNADLIALVRELAKRHTDAQIARVLIRKNIATPTGLTFNALRVTALRRNHDIPCYQQSKDRDVPGHTVQQAAGLLHVSAPTIHRWLTDGLLKGDQITSGAPWRILVSEEDKKRLTASNAPSGWLSLNEAAIQCGVTKQAVAQWVKQAKVPFVYVAKGKRRGLRIDVSSTSYKAQQALFS